MKYIKFASAYGEGLYGACGYSESGRESVTCPAIKEEGIGPKSELANTGIELWVFATGACLLIFAGLVIRIWRRGSAAKPAQKGVPVKPKSSARSRSK